MFIQWFNSFKIHNFTFNLLISAAAMSELKGISESKIRKEAAMQEIKDRETTKEVKSHAMAELKKVADIKEKVGAVELPIGAAEKVIGIPNLILTPVSWLKLTLSIKDTIFLQISDRFIVW